MIKKDIKCGVGASPEAHPMRKNLTQQELPTYIEITTFFNRNSPFFGPEWGQTSRTCHFEGLSDRAKMWYHTDNQNSSEQLPV